MIIDDIAPETEAARRDSQTGTPLTPEVDISPVVYRKNCCGIPREERCLHDLPAAAFEPGSGKPIMCRPASQWGNA